MEKQQFEKLPEHIAFILDGNGRWATLHQMERIMGHNKGIKVLRSIVNEVRNLGIKYMSAYVFSVENMGRPRSEVEYLMNRAFQEFASMRDSYDKLQYNIRIIGERTNLTAKILDVIDSINQKPFIENAFTLFIAFNYSSQLELVHVMKEIKLKKLAVTKDNVEKLLYTHPAPPIDFLIRTSGEMRLSNFMLYQASYAELYFPKVYWPAFTKRQLYKALEEYQGRKRRFGKL